MFHEIRRKHWSNGCFAVESSWLQPATSGQSLDVAQGSDRHQHFVCNTGYTLEKCHKDVADLRKTLDKYQAAQLGEWTWVLVRSNDWKAITQPRGMNPDSPAFTYYAGKETFLEEALVTVVPQRSASLLITWGMRRDDLLDFAVTHELGHALCNEKSEVKTEYVARELRAGDQRRVKQRCGPRKSDAMKKTAFLTGMPASTDPTAYRPIAVTAMESCTQNLWAVGTANERIVVRVARALNDTEGSDSTAPGERKQGRGPYN